MMSEVATETRYRVDGMDCAGVRVQDRHGGKATFAPGGLHIMLEGLQEPCVEGTLVLVPLVFEQAGEVQVESVHAASPSSNHQHAGSGMNRSLDLVRHGHAAAVSVPPWQGTVPVALNLMHLLRFRL